MGDLTAAETDGHLDLVPVLQELDRVARLDGHVIFTDGGRKLHFLDFNDLLVFPQLLFPLGLLVAMLVVVQQLADRRLGVGNDFHQIQLRLFRQFQRPTYRDNPQLSAVRADQADLTVTNFLIDLQFRVDDDAPPNKNQRA